MPGQMVALFDALGMGDINDVGGKCASLGEMHKLGVPVPFGFAVTTEAFEYFLKETGASDQLEKCKPKCLDDSPTIDDLNNMEKIFQGIILEKTIPVEIVNAVNRAYAALCERYGTKDMAVAVRSSGVAEDSPTTSFAGQYESYLNVKGLEAVLQKIKECWASMFTARGISYRLKQKMPILGGGMSVAVMKMVNSKASGVAFTIIPSTMDASKMLVEGNFGVGESVVQGIVTPDRFIIDKRSLEIEQKVINRKSRQYSMKESGTEEEDVPAGLQTISCLSDEELKHLGKYFRIIDTYYGVPMDIEWAIDRDLPFPKNLFLVQARPVTIKEKQKDAQEFLCELLINLSSDTLINKEVLVVDDETDILETVEELLESCNVHKITDYNTAAQCLKNESYDIVILDIMGVNGFELLRIANERGFPTVMLTAHALTHEALTRSAELGAKGFVPKEKITQLRKLLEVMLLEGGKDAWKEVIYQFEPFFNKKFGLDWKKRLSLLVSE